MEEEGVVVPARGEGGEVLAGLREVSGVETEGLPGVKGTFGACSL